MDYVKIPQNVRVEDKLIGPLSLRQIIMIAIGGGFSYALYAMANKTYGYVPAMMHVFIWLPAAVAGAFAVVRINDISLFRYCLLIVEMMSKPRKRVWQPRQGLIVNIQTQQPKKKKKQEGGKGKGKGSGTGAPIRLSTTSFGGQAEMVEEGENGRRKQAIRLEDLSVILDRKESDVTRVSLDPLENNVDSVRQPVS